MTLTPQLYHPSTLADALAAGCDTVQHKYDGQWVRVEISRGFMRVYDSRGTDIDTPMSNEVAPECGCGSFIGNLLLDHSFVYLWDCWSLCDNTDVRVMHHDIEGFPYRNRYAMLVDQLKKMTATPLIGPMNRIRLVKNHPIRAAKELWESGETHTCGLVFRDSQAKVGVTLKVARRYREVPGELA